MSAVPQSHQRPRFFSAQPSLLVSSQSQSPHGYEMDLRVSGTDRSREVDTPAGPQPQCLPVPALAVG